MQHLEQLAQEKELEFEALKDEAFQRYEKGKLYKDHLEFYLNQVFRLGHYTGHVRGEIHGHNLYKGVVNDEDE